jgi:hypothetical protein
MDDPRIRLLARLIAGAAIAVGAFYLGGDLLAPAPTHDRVRFDAPVEIGPHTLALAQRRTSDGVFVDVQYGPHTIAGVAPVMANTTPGGVYARYATRFTLYAPRAPQGKWKLVEVDAASSVPGVRLIELPADPPRAVMLESPTLTATQSELARLTLGSTPRPVPLLPGPTLLLLGAAVWLSLGTRRPAALAPTINLVLVLAALGAMIAWPMLLHVGAGPGLPAAVLGLIVTLIVAAAAGPRLQAIAFRGRAGSSALAGALVGAGLLGVFVLAAVNIQGFIAPVFRPPGEGLSPAAWFMTDFVTPALAIGGTFLLPALLGGVVYALLGRRKGLRK